MHKDKKNDELQSRRQFFKNAAKGALPILGAIVLANVPSIMNAASESPMGCKYGCSSGCSGTCSGSCSGTCRGGCRGDCQGTCKYGCNVTCKGSCSATCHYTCSGGNYGK